jgi:hypothetical protein
MKKKTIATVAAALLAWAAAEPCQAVEPERSPLVPSSALRAMRASVPVAASVAAGEHGLHWGLSLGMPVATPRGTAADPLALRPAWRVDAMFNASHDPALRAPTGGLATSLRLERATARMAGWLGVSRGGERAERDPEARLRLGGGIAQVLGEIRGELSWVTSSVLFSGDERWTRSWLEDITIPRDSMPDSVTSVARSETVSHETLWQAAQATLRWARGRWSVDGVGGLSMGEGVTARRWAQARMGVQLTRHVAMHAAWGERPAAALAFEDNAPPRTMVGLEVKPWVGRGTGEPPRLSGWRATPSGRGLLLIRVQARAAKAVELTGDLTDWAPLVLERVNGGWWAVLVQASAGLHRVQVRMDGGPWQAPPGLPRAADSGGGPAGMLFVEGEE